MGISLEHQVVSLELAKKLKALNVKQESLYTWVCYRARPWPNGRLVSTSSLTVNPKDNGGIFRLSAFTVAELGIVLKWEAQSYKRKDRSTWNCISEHKPNSYFEADTEADARAKMVCYLVEKGLLEACAL